MIGQLPDIIEQAAAETIAGPLAYAPPVDLEGQVKDWLLKYEDEVKIGIGALVFLALIRR